MHQFSSDIQVSVYAMIDKFCLGKAKSHKSVLLISEPKNFRRQHISEINLPQFTFWPQLLLTCPYVLYIIIYPKTTTTSTNCSIELRNQDLVIYIWFRCSAMCSVPLDLDTYEFKSLIFYS